MSELVRQEICVGSPPSNQAAIDCIPGWSSEFPAGIGVSAGGASLFNDARVTWALEQLGGATGRRVLELGPLEGAHTWMLEQAGAASITAIEANRRSYMKCLITKELLGIQRARFLLGDFMPWLEATRERFDLVFAAGVLYHMAEPIRLLRLLAQVTDRLYIWTHYFPDDPRPDEAWAPHIVAVENRDDIPHHIYSYGDLGQRPTYCGGVYRHAAWLKRSDILAELERLGFQRIAINGENRAFSNGPCFNLVAAR